MPKIDIPIDNARDILKHKIYFQIFLAVSTALTLSEPFLVSYPAHGITYELQSIVLAASSFLFFFGVFLCLAHYPEQDVENDKTLFAKFVDMFDGEVVLELLCLIWGWVFLYDYPGVAALRCIRVFRLLWYFELFLGDSDLDVAALAHTYYSPVRAVDLSLEYIEKLGNEFLTEKTGGGIVFLIAFFFVTYITAVVFWVDKPDLVTNEGIPCASLKTCFIVMLRFSFWDGNGFDYLEAVYQEDHKDSGGYAVLMILYMIVAVIIILFGLIGIFGNSFTNSIKSSDSDAEGVKKRQTPRGKCIYTMLIKCLRVSCNQQCPSCVNYFPHRKEDPNIEVHGRNQESSPRREGWQ